MGKTGTAESRPVYTSVGVEICKISWDAHMNKVVEKGGTQIGRMDVILKDSHPDTRMKRCILMNICCTEAEVSGEVWKGDEKLVKRMKTIRVVAAQIVLGCSKTTGNTALRAEFELYPLEDPSDIQKLSWQYSAKNMQRKIAGRG